MIGMITRGISEEYFSSHVPEKIAYVISPIFSRVSSCQSIVSCAADIDCSIINISKQIVPWWEISKGPSRRDHSIDPDPYWTESGCKCDRSSLNDLKYNKIPGICEVKGDEFDILNRIFNLLSVNVFVVEKTNTKFELSKWYIFMTLVVPSNSACKEILFVAVSRIANIIWELEWPE